ncbi:MAG: hypothetical protein Q7P63_00840 [Verrucomicrobiota bacterium JB022]|nr:hypothetical protein [Verrucomicrobiota bacterium JB022]
MQRSLFLSLLVGAGSLLCAPAHAIILYGAGNDATTSDPGGGLPFTNVARVTNNAGSVTWGSAVYLGNGWVLGASHVGTINYVQFNAGGARYARDTSTSTVRLGSSDLVLTKLTSLPNLPSVPIYDFAQLRAGGVMVGWGLGRASTEALYDNNVTWGDSSTAARRWGLNAIEAVTTYTDSADRTTEAFVTVAGNADPVLELPQFNSFQGDYEASATQYDSGSAFYTFYNDVWYLSGLTLAVEKPNNQNATLFGIDNVTDEERGNYNIFANLSLYATQINAVVNPSPAPTVPEPKAFALLGGTAALGLLGWRRRQK